MPDAAHSENKMDGSTNKTSFPTHETRKDSATGTDTLMRGKKSQIAPETSATTKKPPISPYISPGQLAK